MTKKTTQRPKKELTRKQASRIRREERQQQILTWSGVAVGVIVVLVLAYGFINETVIKARKPAAVVGDTPIQMRELVARVTFLRTQTSNELMQWQSQRMALDPEDEDSQFYLDYIDGRVRELQDVLDPVNALDLADQARSQLVQEELARQEAARRGISVSADDVQLEIERGWGYERDSGTAELDAEAAVDTPAPDEAEATPTVMTEEDFQKQYREFVDSVLKPMGISETLYRSWVEAGLLTQRLRDAMVDEVPATAEQVNVRVFMATTEDEAQTLLDRWNSGEEFSALADELAADDAAMAYGWELGWLPRSTLEGQFGTAVADMAFGLAVGERGGPVVGPDGSAYVMEVLEREERALDDAARQQLADEAFAAWMEAQEAVAVQLHPIDAGSVPTTP